MDSDRIYAQISTGFWGRIFCRKYDNLAIAEDCLLVRRGLRIVKTIPFAEIDCFANFKKGVFGAKICLAAAHEYAWLKKDACEKFIDLLNQILRKFIEPAIGEMLDEFEQLAFHCYPRDSWWPRLEELGHSLGKFKKFATDKRLIAAHQKKRLLQILELLPVDIGKLAEFHENRQLMLRKDFLDTIEKYPLGYEQRLAVLRNNDRNLVLAAAGTGKTSVIIAKIFDLLERKLCEADEILVLSYNRSTANEIRERVRVCAARCKAALKKRPEVSTFHALGRKILAETGLSVNLSELAVSDSCLQRWVAEWLEKRVRENYEVFLEMSRFFPEPIDPFGLTDRRAYQKRLRDNDFRTLQGEKVAGQPELLIANYLALHGIAYTYGNPYIVRRRLCGNAVYRPKFHLTGTRIYIEYMLVDRNGRTPGPLFNQHSDSEIDAVRALHREMDTILVETCHYEWKEGIILGELDKKLRRVGIIPGKLEAPRIKALVERNRERIGHWSEILTGALRAIRVENLDAAEILKRLKKASLSEADRKTVLLEELVMDYKSGLMRSNSIDFEDMLVKASEMIRTGAAKPVWKYILVDEFQDISSARMELINDLVAYGPSPSLTVAGDDWQAIYRFSGGVLAYTTRFSELVGGCSTVYLRRTYRYHDDIARMSEKFVTANPSQTKKNVEAENRNGPPRIFLHDPYAEDGKFDPAGKVLALVNTIRNEDRFGTVAIICRYNQLLDHIGKSLPQNIPGLYFWTFHRSKGLEADHVILVGLWAGIMGFPCENRDYAIIEALLPEEDSWPHAEERRLMYVGMTRARGTLHIIADPARRSDFIVELSGGGYELKIVSPFFSEEFHKIYKCPWCDIGYLEKRSGKYGEFYACSGGRSCPSGIVRVCARCGAPSIDSVAVSKCARCGHEMAICEKCGRPMTERTGKYGRFLGCTGFAGGHCSHTVPLS